MSHHNIPANTTRHSKLQGVLAMTPTIEDQLRAFTSWKLGSRQFQTDLRDILDLIKTHGNILKSALMSLQSVYDGLSNDSDDVVGDLETKLHIDLSKEVAGAKDLLVAVNAAYSNLNIPSSNFVLGKIFRSSQKEALNSFGIHFAQLKSHLRLINMMTRRLRHASRTGTKDESDVFSKEYARLERMHSKQVLERLRLRFDQDPFAVTVPLDPKREQSDEEGRDHANKLYDYLDKEEDVKVLLRQFQDMGSKWAAAMIGGSSTPEMRALEMAYTKLSCGVMNALQQSVPRDEGTCPLLDDTDFLQCRLAKWEELTSGQKIIIAIGGHFSHGKSSFLNSLMGENVLPTNNKFTTAIPCRIQHKADAELTLEIPQLEPYQKLLTRVTEYSLSHKVNDIPDNSMVKEAAEFVKRCEDATFLVDPRADLASGQATKLMFTERETVREQLDLLNNLVRLGSQLRDSKPLNLDSPDVWPILTYDIAILSLGNVTANVQFLDLPGFNDEVFSPTGQSAAFYSMMKHAAEEASLIIPVVSYPTVHKNFGAMWTEWEQTLYQKKWKDRIPVVMVTKAAQQGHTQQKYELVQHKIASKVWKTSEQHDRVLFCDSLIGLGAMQLERLYNKCIENQGQETAEWNPRYSPLLATNIQDASSPMHHLKRLGQSGFLEYQRSDWSDFLEKAHLQAGVEKFNLFLASKICDESPRRRLEAFHQIFPAAFQKLKSMHEQAIRDLRMPEEDFNKIASQADNDTKQVEEGLKGWKTMTGDAIARRTQPTRDFRKAFEDSVWREWVAVKKELEKSLLGASSQDRLSKFSSRMEYRRHVDPYINKLARSLAAIQAQHVDNILEIASQGVQEVIDSVDNFTNNLITDDSWKDIVNTSMKEFRDIPNVLVSRLKSKIKGTAADRNYTAATLLESLHSWAPLTDEPFNCSLGYAPRMQNASNQDSITIPVTTSPVLPILSQLSEMNLVEPTPEPTNDHTPDEPQYTTKEWATNEFKDSGFLIFVPSPDDWLDVLPTDNAVVYRITDDDDDDETMEVYIDIDKLLGMTEAKFIKPYIEAIVDRTNATSCGWLAKIAEACEQTFEQLMLNRREELNRRRRERGGSKGSHVIRVVRHLMAVANLTAADAAIKVLQDAVVEWDRMLKPKENADILAASINYPRVSSVIP